MDDQTTRPVRVWDLFVRLFHWSLVSSVGLALWTAGDARWQAVHVFAGWWAAGLLIARIGWAFVGTTYARWSSWLRPLPELRQFVTQLIAGRAPRHLGHNPLAGWAMAALFGLLGVVVVTGVVVDGGQEGHGPLAGLSAELGVATLPWHRWAGWAVLAWAGLHLAGVAKESLRLRENLVGSMIRGHKPGPGAAVPRAGRAAAVLGGLSILGATAWFADPRWAPTVAADDPAWREACGECHLAYAPRLLPARSWERMLVEQDRHFDEDLGLDEATLAGLRAFLVANAADGAPGEEALLIRRSIPDGEAPQRISTLPWWEQVHAELPEAEVDNPARCDDCHLDADAGGFEAGSIQFPAKKKDT